MRFVLEKHQPQLDESPFLEKMRGTTVEHRGTQTRLMTAMSDCRSVEGGSLGVNAYIPYLECLGCFLCVEKEWFFQRIDDRWCIYPKRRWWSI